MQKMNDFDYQNARNSLILIQRALRNFDLAFTEGDFCRTNFSFNMYCIVFELCKLCDMLGLDAESEISGAVRVIKTEYAPPKVLGEIDAV